MAVMLVLTWTSSRAQIGISALPYAYTQNFNNYNPSNASNLAATLPSGWTATGASAYQGRATGTGNSGGYYAYGSGSDYSAGALRSGQLTITYAVSFVNNSATTITDLTLSWNYEQWRFANNDSGWDVTGTGALAGNATLNSKDFNGVSTGTNGTVATTPVAAFTLSGLSIAPGQSFGLSWATTDGTSADNGVAIDDFSISASAVVLQDQTITFAPLANATYGDSAITLGASASSGLTVSYVSSNTNVATVSGSTLTIVGAGTTNITASQGGNTNYNAATPVVRSLTVDPKSLTVSGAAAQDKIYDRTTSAQITGSLNGVINGDDVALANGGTFNDFNAGQDKPVTAALTLTGTKAANYILTQPSGLTADIFQKDLTIEDAEAQNKLFDGTTDAVITGTLTGVIAPDVVTFNGTGVFASAAAAQNISVTATATLAGDTANYNLVQPVGLTANIYAEPLQPQTITFAPLAHVTYGDANFNLTATASSGLTVAYTSSDESVATVSGNVVTIVGAGTTTITANQEGNGSFEEAAPVAQTLTVDPKALTIALALANDKVYDGNTNATFTGTLSGIVGDDEVTFNGTGTFASAVVASGIAVASTATLAGQDAANYTLTQPAGLSADITVKTLTATASANNKVYDGTTAATLSNIVLSGVVGQDDVVASGDGIFASEDAANNIPVTATLTLSGADAFNYVVSQPSGLTANITRLALTISGVAALDKVYDRTTAATLTGTAQLNGVLGSDNVVASGAPTGTFSSRTVGTNKTVTVSGYTLAGPDAGNYTVTPPSGITADITPASVTIANAAAQDKPFDGTTNAVITGTLAGVITPDAVTLVGTGTFASAAVGTDIAVTSTATLGGADGGNYVINPQPAGLTADITPGPTTLAAGDLAIIGFNVNTPDNFAFVSWVDLNSGTIIKFTDNAFLSGNPANQANNARGGEQFVIWRNNGATIPAGTVITIQDNAVTSMGQIVSGNLNGLANSGDGIFAYQGSATSGTTPDWASNSNPTTFNGQLVFGLNIGAWLTSGTASTNTSYLPSDLNFPGGNIAVAVSTRGQYTGPRNTQTTLAGYKTLVTTPSNWTTATGSGVLTLNTTGFTIATPPTAAELSGAGTICAGDTANLYVFVTGGLAPFKVTYTDGANEFVVDNYVSGTTIPVMPDATTTYTLVSVTDANTLASANNSGSALINVNQKYPFYTDADADGYGTGDAVLVCSVDANTAPAGYALVDGDCNDNIAAIHPNATEIPYNGVDDDCDGAIDETGTVNTTLLASSCGSTLASIGSIIGIQTVGGHPITGYRIRATNGSQVQTIERTAPNFTMTQFGSYAYATTYTIEVQLQRAGIWQASWGAPCLVSTPAILAEGGAGTVNPSQCGITLAQINTLIATTSLPGVTGYRFRVSDLTNPTGPNAVQTIDRAQNWFSLQMLTRYNYGTQYRLEVSVKTTGDFGGYGTPCELFSPAVPQLVNCGGSVALKTTAIATSSVPGATQYRFQIVRASDNASATIDRGVNWFNFNMIPAQTYTIGGLYYVRVAVMTAGTWSPFGDSCEITAPTGTGKGVIAAADATASAEFRATAYPNPFASDFSLDIATSSQEKIQVKVYDMLGKLVESKELDAADAGATKVGAQFPAGVYNVIVSQDGVVKTLRVIKR